MSKWPLKYRFWKRLHGIANRLAWKYACPPGPAWGRASRIDHNNIWWRINDFLANRWSKWYIESRGYKVKD